MWRHSFRFSMAMQHRHYPFASLCLFDIFSLVYALSEMHPPAYPTNAPNQVVLTQSVEEAIPVKDGSWDPCGRTRLRNFRRCRYASSKTERDSSFVPKEVRACG
jgi:hypothetical protein